MATEIQITKDCSGIKSYATRENARKAVAKLLGPDSAADKLRYFIHQFEDGRFAPVFVGMRAVDAGIHFHHHVIG